MNIHFNMNSCKKLGVLLADASEPHAANSAANSTFVGKIVLATSLRIRLHNSGGPQYEIPREWPRSISRWVKRLLCRMLEKLAPREPWAIYVPSASIVSPSGPTTTSCPRSHVRTSSKAFPILPLCGNSALPGFQLRNSPGSKLEMNILMCSHFFRSLMPETKRLLFSCTYFVRSTKRLGKQRSS